MENHTRQNRTIPARQQSGGRGFAGLIPWLGGVFWLLLWGWLLLPRKAIEIPIESKYTSQTATSMHLEGFRVRQETRYTDGGSTYMDLQAERGRKDDNNTNISVLSNVEVRLVTKKQNQPEEAKQGLDALTERVDVAWVLLKATTGEWSISTRDINLMGNVRIFGYSTDGKLTEWFSTEHLVYKQKVNSVTTITPAVYEGFSVQIGHPIRCLLETQADLSEINITNLDPLPEDFPTPFRNPEMLPPYIPPEALKYIHNTPQPGL